MRTYKSTEKSHRNHLGESIKKYIETNCADPSLSLISVADEFSLSTKYVSVLIKEQTGLNYSDFLEKVRLTKSTVLLKDSNKSIKEISEQVGFASLNTFYKAFKRRYLISPSSWRQAYQQK